MMTEFTKKLQGNGRFGKAVVATYELVILCKIDVSYSLAL